MTSYVNECDLRTIDCANGAIEYLWVDITDAQQENITADPVSISLGTFDAPGTWHTADLIEQNGAVWQIRAGLLIGGTYDFNGRGINDSGGGWPRG